MKSVTVHQYDAFSKIPGKGNPAGVILNGDDLSEKEMQLSAFLVGFNEIAVPLNSDRADLRIRFFSPKREMDLCGHAIVATLNALKTRNLLPDKESLTIETKAGILAVSMTQSVGNDWQISLTQPSPQFELFDGSRKNVAQAIGLAESDIDDSLPLLYGSTGSWTLLVPIKCLDAFSRMTPDNKTFPEILKAFPHASIHPFCLETIHADSNMHGRHFSSPGTGSIEDPVTGTASGVMGAYYAKYIDKDLTDYYHLSVEQGQEIGKDGRVYVDVSRQKNALAVSILGEAVYVQSFNLTLKD
ncbi:PhzF family phenazine biosynthesis isomerase [Alkalibacterium psychrotolerans]